MMKGKKLKNIICSLLFGSSLLFLNAAPLPMVKYPVGYWTYEHQTDTGYFINAEVIFERGGKGTFCYLGHPPATPMKLLWQLHENKKDIIITQFYPYTVSVYLIKRHEIKNK